MADESGAGEDRRRGVAVPLRRRKPLNDSTQAPDTEDGAGASPEDQAAPPPPPPRREAAPPPPPPPPAAPDSMDFAAGANAEPPPAAPLLDTESAGLEPPLPPPPQKKPAGGGRKASKGGIALVAILLLGAAAGLGGYYYWTYSQQQSASNALSAASSGSIKAAQVFYAGRLDEARNLAQRAIADAQAGGNPDAVPLAEAVLGRVELEQNQAAQGRARLESVLARFNTQTAPLSVALALEGLGKDAAAGRNDARAVELLNQAAEAYEQAGQGPAARSARLSATEIASRSNDPSLAREALQRALADARANGEQGSIARILTALAELADRTAAPDRLDRLNEAADALTAANRAAEAARLRLRIASLEEEAGNKEAALASLRQVISVLGNVPGSGTVLRNAYKRAADIARDLNDVEQERSLRAEAIEATRASGEAVPLIGVLADAAQRDLAIGFFDSSLSRAQEAAEAAEALNDPRSAGKAWADVALAAIRLNNTQLANTALERSQANLGKVNDPALTAFLGVRRGVILANAGKFSEALAAYQQSAAIFDRVGEERNKGVALMNAADSLWRINRPEDAKNMLNQAEGIFSKADFTAGLDFALEQRGQIDLAEGNREAGMAKLSTALDAHKVAGRWYNAAALSMQLGGMEEEAGNGTAARLRYEEAEQLFGKLGLEDRRIAAKDAAEAIKS